MLSANISDPSKCLLWTGAINNRGYGHGYRACRTCRRLADRRYRANRPLLREYLREVEP